MELSFNQANIALLNDLGQKLATIYTGSLATGKHKIVWNISEKLNKGIYIVQIKVGKFLGVRRLVVQ